MIRKYILLLTSLCLTITACTSPIEVAQRTAQAGQTPTPTPDLSAPALTLQPSGQPTRNPDQNADGQSPCSSRDRQESVTATLWDNPRQKYRLIQLDPMNGQHLCGSTSFPFEQYQRQAVSPDGKLLASFNYQDEYYQEGSLSLVDINAWQIYTTTVKVNAEVNRIAFNSTGDLLAFALLPQLGAQDSRSPLVLFDLKSRKVVETTTLDFIPRFIQFTADSKWLEIYGSTAGGETEQQPIASVLLLWVSRLSLAWRQPLNVLDGSMLVGPKDQEKALVTYSPGLAYIPGQDVIYLVSANEEKYTIIDYINRSIETKEIHPGPATWLDRLLTQTAGVAQARAIWGVQKQAILSADGKQLYITGQATGTTTGTSQPEQDQGPLGLQVIDLKTGDQTAQLDNKTIDLQTSPDGKYLFLRSWDRGIPSTDVLTTAGLEVVAHLPGQSLVVTRTFAGQVILFSVQEGLTDSQVSLLDPRTFEYTYTWPTSGKPLWLTY